MHQTRAQLTKKIPLARKGTKYVVRSSSHLQSSVPVLIAVRDMLKLALTAKEVKEMIKQKSLKINGREVKDTKESINLFNIFHAGKDYILTFSPLGKFSLEETKDKDRLAKVVGKKILKGKKVQINLHDGTNILSNEKISVGDSVYVDQQNKIIKSLSIEKAKEGLVISGKYIGKKGKIRSIKPGEVEMELDGKTVLLRKGGIIAI